MLLRPLPTQSEHSHVGNSGWQSTQNGRMLTPRVVEHALDESRSATLMLGVRTLRLPGTIETCRELTKTARAAGELSFKKYLEDRRSVKTPSPRTLAIAPISRDRNSVVNVRCENRDSSFKLKM